MSGDAAIHLAVEIAKIVCANGGPQYPNEGYASDIAVFIDVLSDKLSGKETK